MLAPSISGFPMGKERYHFPAARVWGMVILELVISPLEGLEPAYSMFRAGGRLGLALGQPDLFFILNLVPEGAAKTCSSCPRAPACLGAASLCLDTLFSLRLCWWSSQRLSRQHLPCLRLRSRPISPQGICGGSPHGADGVHGEVGGPSVLTKVLAPPRWASEAGQDGPS